ncbi:hypothetical protein BDY19DRAFT_911163 [Irpex rosettiformis]|uniref:Uncharacterized protein n=1 Tax=Irpex rosettiformis TaxID=378272 RepID=A0ACB8UIP7_9APHY|nr:hypothetical protein BDY19DRAFT_911163 [Irpex rosettiformis]
MVILSPAFKTSALPGPRSHQRQRGKETPSHLGGLSETGHRRLEEYRWNMGKRLDGITV